MPQQPNQHDTKTRLALLELRVSVLWRFMQGVIGMILLAVGGALLKLVLRGAG